MEERKNQSIVCGLNDKRLLSADEVCYYLSLGRCRGVEFAKFVGAEVKIGRRSLYDRVKIDHYLNEKMEV